MKKRDLLKIKRRRRIRLRILPDDSRPRLVVQRSLKNLSAQIIDDTKNKTLFAMSTLNKEVKSKITYGGNVKSAQLFGEIFAAKAKDKGIVRIVFDRAGYLYHGRIKAFAEALRKGDLAF